MKRWIALGLLALSLGAGAQTYRWVDPATGKTMITDTPPPKTAKNASKSENNEETSPYSYAVKQAMEYFPVTLYTTVDCLEECKKARELLNNRGVPFTEKMVQKPEELAELKQLIGDGFVPTLKVGRQPIRGMNPDGYNNLLDLAGYPKKAPIGSKPSGGLAR